jgi:hypothetical protein
MSQHFEFGTRVAFAREFLRNTGQFTGQDAPTHVGPFARGIVKAVVSFGARKLVMVHWDDGHAGNVLDCNLWPVDRLHLEP